MVALVIELLKKHEGFRDHVYRCTAGKKTIGYGYNLDANPKELTKLPLPLMTYLGNMIRVVTKTFQDLTLVPIIGLIQIV